MNINLGFLDMFLFVEINNSQSLDVVLVLLTFQIHYP